MGEKVETFNVGAYAIQTCVGGLVQKLYEQRKRWNARCFYFLQARGAWQS